MLQYSFDENLKNRKNSKKFVYYNENMYTNSKFQTQLSRKLQRFRTCCKNKKCSIFHELFEYQQKWQFWSFKGFFEFFHGKQLSRVIFMREIDCTHQKNMLTLDILIFSIFYGGTPYFQTQKESSPRKLSSPGSCLPWKNSKNRKSAVFCATLYSFLA